jgi:hypothetical protein
LEVPREATIVKEYERISVHELASGDRVRITGRSSGENRISAERILVASRVDGRFPEEAIRDREPGLRGFNIEGTIVSHDAARTRVRVRAGEREYIVRTEAARISFGEHTLERTELQRADRVWATGRLRGNELFAERIELR